MEIAISPYIQEHLSAATGATVNPGLLLKIQWPRGFVGVSDLMPHPQFGDASVENCVESVQNLPPEQLFQAFTVMEGFVWRSFAELVQLQTQVIKIFSTSLTVSLRNLCALSLFHNLLDAWLRAHNRTAFHELRIPASHRLVSSLQLASPRELQKFIQSSADLGFPAVKVKVQGNSQEKVQFLESIAYMGTTAIPVRLDFNSGAHFEDLCTTLKRLRGRTQLNQIEFIEDPCPYSANDWQQLRDFGLCIANDFAQPLPSPVQAQVAVIKPVRQPLQEALESPQQLCVTHSMDSKIGQSVAAFWAGMLARELPERVTCPGVVYGGTSPEFQWDKSSIGFGGEQELQEREWLTIFRG